MDEKPWWRDSRQLPPSTLLDRYLGGVTPRGLIFAGVLLVVFGLLAILLPGVMPFGLTAFGGALLGQGVVLRRKELREPSSASPASERSDLR